MAHELFFGVATTPTMLELNVTAGLARSCHNNE